MSYSLKRFKLSEQLLRDPLKVLALFERILLNVALTLVVFLILKKLDVTPEILNTALISGVLTFSLITFKGMYYNQALSKIYLNNGAPNTAIDNFLRTAGYAQNEEGEYVTPKKMFSLFYRCDSEKVIVTTQGSCLILKGPYAQIKDLLIMLASTENTLK